MKNKIRVAVVGVGNCASALIQGVQYYKNLNISDGKIPGILFSNIGGYEVTDIEFALAIDVDERKVGKPLREAMFAHPNCCRVFCKDISDEIGGNIIVKRGRTLDGISEHMRYEPEVKGFREVEGVEECDVVKELIENKIDVLLNYLPVGSQQATEFYMNCAIEAKVAVVNCIPVFIASNEEWEQKFIDAELPIIGDDMKSQLGASILSQVLNELVFDRGLTLDFHQQINVGGNTDFNNMMNQSRLASKKISKENVLRAVYDRNDYTPAYGTLFAGPSTFIPYLDDNKVAYFRIEAKGFGDAPVTIDAKLSVQDSENSAGVVIDALRFVKVARELGIIGSLRGCSALSQKTPPVQLTLEQSLEEARLIADRKVPHGCRTK